MLEPRAQVDLDAAALVEVAALVEAAVLVELGGPPERGQRAGDGHEASVPHAPGPAPEPDQSDDVEQREPSQQCQPGVFAGHASHLPILLEVRAGSVSHTETAITLQLARACLFSQSKFIIQLK